MVAKSNPNEIRLIRIYDAPVEVVWDAWNDPLQAAKWWGPRGFTLTTHSKELRPGGHWAYTMHGPDGTNYENKTLYYEVEHCKKLVYDHGGNDDRPPLFRVTVLFSESNGNTTMDFTMAFASADEAQTIGKFIKEVGGNSTWDRLAEYVNATQRSRTTFVTNYSLTASVAEVYAHCSTAERLAQWLAPTEMPMQYQAGQVAIGSEAVFQLESSDNRPLLCKLSFNRLEARKCVGFVQSFYDPENKPIPHPDAPTYSQATHVLIVLTPEDNDSSRITVVAEPVGNLTNQQLSAFEDMRINMARAWSRSFDRLEALP